MVYSLDIGEEGKKCSIVVNGKNIECVVVSAYERKNKNGSLTKKYNLQDKDRLAYDGIDESNIVIKNKRK